jgi:threonine/homoserine/homoserine lactone efflux protein
MILKAFVFGLFLAVAVGPIAMLIVSYGLRFGPAAGVRSAVGAATGDLVFAALAIAAGAAVTPILARYRETVSAISALVLVGFGLLMLRSALQLVRSASGPAPADRAVDRPFATTFLLTIANPLTVVAFAGFVTQLDRPLGIGLAAQVLLALFAASLSVQLAFAFGGAAAGRVIGNPSWARALNVVGAVGIIGYGLANLITQ